MCLTPIYIKNPRRFYRNGLDKVNLQVPCGKCLECQQEKLNDWFVRLAYQYYDCVGHDGGVYFPTITYNSLSLPYLDTSQDDFKVLNDISGKYVQGITPTCPTFRHMSFDKAGVQKFFKSLRQNLASPYLPKKYQLHITKGLKYFLVSEFGTNKHRPHYHAQIFLPRKLQQHEIWIFKKVLELSWSSRLAYKDVPDSIKLLLQTPRYLDLLAKGELIETRFFFVLPPRKGQNVPQVFKRKGFVSWSEHGAEVKSVANVRYILKYLFKDSNFMKQPCVKLLDDYVKGLPCLKTVTNPVQLKVIKQLKDFFPFHLSSIGLGESLFKQLDIKSLTGDELEEATQKLCDGVVSVPEDEQLYAIPKYIIRRLFYNYETVGQVENVCRLTPEGVTILKMKYEYTVRYLVNTYRMVMSSEYLSMFTEDNKNEYLSHFHRPIEEFFTLYNQMFDSLFQFSLKALATYALVYRGVSYESNSMAPFLSLEDLTLKAKRILFRKIDTYNVPDEDYYYNIPVPLNSVSSAVYANCTRYMYNELPQFFNFDFILDSIGFIKSKVQFRKKKNRKEMQDFNHRLHRLYVSYMYN